MRNRNLRVDENYTDFYSDIAINYDSLRYGGVYGSVFRELHHRVLKDCIQGNGEENVLEVACGTGHTTELLEALGLDCVACDLTQNMMQLARSRVGSATFIRANAFQLPFRDESFGVVISTRFLHLFSPNVQRNVLSEMVRVLKPGGRLIVDFDNFSSRWILAVPHFLYNLVRYRRMGPDTNYNTICGVESCFNDLGLNRVECLGVAGYHLAALACLSKDMAVRVGNLHRTGPLRMLAEQFIATGIKGR